MIAFILAAGFGTRLKPLSDHIPKALVPVCGKPLLSRAYDFFRLQGVNRIAMNSHHHPEQLSAYIKNEQIDIVDFYESGTIRGTGGALYFARDFLASDDVFCVANADIVADVNLRQIYAKFCAMNCDIGLVMAPALQKGSIVFNTISLDYIGTTKEVAADSSCKEQGEFIGMALYKKEVLSLLTTDDFSVVPLWKRAQQAGLSVKVLKAGNIYWKDCGTPQTLAQIHFDVLDGMFLLPMPRGMVLNTKDTKAYPRTFTDAMIRQLGSYTWWEKNEISQGISVSHAVVLQNGVLPEQETIRYQIITEFGAISCGS